MSGTFVAIANDAFYVYLIDMNENDALNLAIMVNKILFDITLHIHGDCVGTCDVLAEAAIAEEVESMLLIAVLNSTDCACNVDALFCKNAELLELSSAVFFITERDEFMLVSVEDDISCGNLSTASLVNRVVGTETDEMLTVLVVSMVGTTIKEATASSMLGFIVFAKEIEFACICDTVSSDSELANSFAELVLSMTLEDTDSFAVISVTNVARATCELVNSDLQFC